MVAVSNSYVAMYGGNIDEEGAQLILYNVQFKVCQTRQSFKLFHPTKMWCIDDNVMLCVGQNLAVVPFFINTQQLSEMVGSHNPLLVMDDVQIIENVEVKTWNGDSQDIELDTVVPENIKTDLEDLLVQGFSERAISEILLNKYIENGDTSGIVTCVEHFNDIPEHCIVDLLNCFLSTRLFPGEEIVEKDSNCLLPPARCDLVDTILQYPCNDVVLVQNIKKNFSLDNILALISYISYLLSEFGHTLPKLSCAQSDKRLIEWSSLLLDASYQKFLLSKDESVLHVLKKLQSLIVKHLTYIGHYNKTLPVLTQAYERKQLNLNVMKGSCKYCIEEVDLY